MTLTSNRPLAALFAAILTLSAWSLTLTMPASAALAAATLA